MLNLIISRTGYGKTTFIKKKINALCKENKETILIIPEQISFESERDILREVGAAELKKVSVMSFTRICAQFFALYGGREKPYIDAVGKTALMEEVLKNLSSSLELFRKAASTPQFCEMMIELSANIKKSAVTPEALSLCAEKQGGILSAKLQETALILSDYEKALGSEYFDPLDDLSVVAERLSSEPFFANKTVFIDSFTGFTAQQMKIIEKIIATAEDTYISLGFDGVYSSNKLSLFGNMAKTALDLKRIASDNGVSVGEDIVLTENFRTDNAELDFLEKNIFSDEKNEYPEVPQNIFITKLKNIYEEAEYIAKSIIDLTRKEGLRYREISVISRDADTYNDVIEEAFEKYGIPLFVDNREGVENLNLFKLVSFALESVNKNFDNESIISLVKTGLTGLDDNEASLFELYTYVWRINKKGFSEEFNMPVDSFLSGDEDYLESSAEDIENARKKVIEPLEKFKATKGKTVKSYVKAIFTLINDYGCGEKLKKQADKLLESGYVRLSDSTVRSYDIMIHILDQLYLSLGENEMSLKRFYEIFSSAVTLLDVGALPQGLDAVAVGSAERMRPKSPKVTFIIGANEGVFPSASAGKGLFTDSELMLLKEDGVNLPFYDVDTAVDEQYLAYCALCSPSKKLFVSYPQFSLSGEVKEPSVIIENLESIFPKIEQKAFDNTEIHTAHDALKAYAISRGNDREIEQYFEENEDILFENLKAAKEEKLKKLEPETAVSLYGKNIYTSASKVETFNKCHFYYFCKYGLHANVIKESKIDNLSRGSLVHFVLENMLNKFSVDEFFELSAEQINAEVDTLAEEFYNGNIASKNDTPQEKYRFKKLCEMVEELVVRVFAELKQSEFEMQKTELSIGGKDGDIKPYSVEFSGGKIILTGFVDRVDKAEKNEKKVLRIIDYKTGVKKFNFSDLLYGQNLQMPLYMKAVLENGKELFGDCIPGGMFYFAAKESVVNAERELSNEDIEAQRLKGVKMGGIFLDDSDVYTAIEPEGRGIFSPVKLKKDATLSKSAPYYTYEQYEILSRYLELKLKETAEKISNGEIAPLPVDGVGVSACDYCDYSSVCRFNGEHKQIENLKQEDVFKIMLEKLNKEGE